MSDTPVPADESDAATLSLVRALWKAADETDELTVGCQWDDLPEPQRSNWLALAEAARGRGVCLIPPVEGDTETAAPTPEGRTVEEWGVETRWGVEWGASVGMSHRYEYTADSVWGLAGGRPVYRRYRTVYRDHLTEPERVVAPTERTTDA